MTLPSFTFEVAWTDEITGVFRVDLSVVDSTTDLLGSGFGANDFDDISSYVQTCSIKRGRSDDLGPMQQGTCSLSLYDPTGRFNPENPTSDLYAYLVPLRPLRVRAVWNAATYGLYFGYIERIEHDPISHHTTIDCVDLFEWLANARDEFTPDPVTTVGDAIGLFLDALEFTDPSFRNLDDGRTISALVVEADADYLGQIDDLRAYDQGVFFITKDGVARFITDSELWANSAPVDALDGSAASAMRPSVDKERILNRQKVTRTGGADQTATNDTSRRTYGYRDGSAITSDYLASDAEALSLARWIVAVYGSPSAPARGIEVVAADDTRTLQVLSREIGERVSFSEPDGGTDAEGVIEGVETTIAIGQLPKAKFLVSKRSVNLFTIGSSEVGGPDIIGW